MYSNKSVKKPENSKRNKMRASHSNSMLDKAHISSELPIFMS